MKNIIFSLLILLPFSIFAQQNKLDGQIKGMEAKKIFISGFYGSEQRPFDSVTADKNGKFNYSFSKNQPAGMYRLRFGENRFIDIIYNHEDIAFETHFDAIIDSLKFTKSIENQLYFDYLKRRNETEYRLSLLNPLLSRYPSDDLFYKQIVGEFTRLSNDLENFINNLISENENTFTAKLIKLDRTPMPDAKMVEDVRIDFMKAHFFDQADFSDTSLLRTSLVSNKLIQYLSFYQNNQMTKDQLEIEFIKAVQVIMFKTKSSPEIYAFAMDYLISGFESYGFEKVITYIADNINLEESCVDDERKAKLENKVESLKKFAVGLKAPDFTATDINGNSVKLSGINSEYTLLVFWATWCPHCTRLIPDLKKIYLAGNKEKLEIVAISLDESKTELDAFLKDGGFDWINISDFKKWKGDIVQLYDIYATPTMLLLAKDGTIAAKPMNFEEVKYELYKRNVLR